ncbi:MAG TPA: ACT domain-containing protein [Thermodesulfovibrionales bacterium]|jgi:hypothetical protein|nr:ACT domain-containing protein [Thermodesulfovibrionales bacterium]
MTRGKKVKQLEFDMPDRPGLLSEVTTALAAAKVNISSICAYGMEGKAFFMLITDGNAKAKKALAKLGAKAEEEDVFAVEMPNKAGELQKVAKKIADAGININYVYGATATGKTATCIFSSSDNKKALKVLSK